jgi:hypothetical protein
MGERHRTRASAWACVLQACSSSAPMLDDRLSAPTHLPQGASTVLCPRAQLVRRVEDTRDAAVSDRGSFRLWA